MRALLLLLLAACHRADTDTDPVETDETDDTDDTDAAHLPPDDFEALLDQKDGCSDTTLHLWDGDGELGLEIYRVGLLQDAIDRGPQDVTLTIGVDTVLVRLEVADPVAVNYCTDALSDRTVFRTFDAVSGTIRLTMDPPAAESAPGTAGVYLTNVVLRDDAGHEVTAESLSATDIHVVSGWGG